jgi:hypothetical protein
LAVLSTIAPVDAGGDEVAFPASYAKDVLYASHDLIDSRGECRFEFTATKSVLRNGEWISVPLAPTAPPKK